MRVMVFIKIPEGEYFSYRITVVDFKTRIAKSRRAHTLLMVNNLFSNIYGSEISNFFEDEIEDAIRNGLVDERIVREYTKIKNK